MIDDSRKPKPTPASFDVPELELQTAGAPRWPRPPEPGLGAERDRELGPRSFEPEPGSDSLPFELQLDLDPVRQVQRPAFGTELDLGEGARVDSGREKPAARPSGRATDPARLDIEPRRVREFADFGPVPATVGATPRYAYRVFKRQRRLKQELAAIWSECAQAGRERDKTLAALAESLRPADKGRPLAALAELGRALLANTDLVDVPEALIERVRVADERVNGLSARHELGRRAIDSYDEVRVAQGVRLSCTLLALLLLLIVFNLVF